MQIKRDVAKKVMNINLKNVDDKYDKV